MYDFDEIKVVMEFNILEQICDGEYLLWVINQVLCQ